MTRPQRTLLLGLLIPVILSLAPMLTATAQDDPSDRLHQLFEDTWDFHDAVLRNGALPLPLLEQQVEDYVEKNAD